MRTPIALLALLALTSTALPHASACTLEACIEDAYNGVGNQVMNVLLPVYGTAMGVYNDVSAAMPCTSSACLGGDNDAPDAGNTLDAGPVMKLVTLAERGLRNVLAFLGLA